MQCEVRKSELVAKLIAHTNVLQNSTDTLEQLECAFDNIKRKLFKELHGVVREQVFPAHPDTPMPQLDLDVDNKSGSAEAAAAGEDISGASSNGKAGLQSAESAVHAK